MDKNKEEKTFEEVFDDFIDESWGTSPVVPGHLFTVTDYSTRPPHVYQVPANNNKIGSTQGDARDEK